MLGLVVLICPVHTHTRTRMHAEQGLVSLSTPRCEPSGGEGGMKSVAFISHMDNPGREAAWSPRWQASGRGSPLLACSLSARLAGGLRLALARRGCPSH